MWWLDDKYMGIRKDWKFAGYFCMYLLLLILNVHISAFLGNQVQLFPFFFGGGEGKCKYLSWLFLT